MGSDRFGQSMCQIYRCSLVIIALATCFTLLETVDHRRASLQAEYESLTTTMQNFPWAEDHNPGSVTAVQFSPATPPAHLPEPRILEKSDGLIRMRITCYPTSHPHSLSTFSTHAYHPPRSQIQSHSMPLLIQIMLIRFFDIFRLSDWCRHFNF